MKTAHDRRAQHKAELLELEQWLSRGCPEPMPDSVARDQAQVREAYLLILREDERFELARSGSGWEAQGGATSTVRPWLGGRPSGAFHIDATKVYNELNGVIPSSRCEGHPAPSRVMSVTRIYAELNKPRFSQVQEASP